MVLAVTRELQGWLCHDGKEVVLPCEADATGPRNSPDRHALAALCLHGQPFGFTQEDVDAVLVAADEADMDELQSVADRIEALLPPRKET